MTSTPSAKTATAARVAGFLALFAAAAHAALALPHTTPSTPSGCTAPAPRATCVSNTLACARTVADTAAPTTSYVPTGR
jgi:hypothetical protein